MKLRAKFLIPLLLFSLTFGGYAQFIWLPRISTTIEARAHQDLQAHLSSVAEGLIPLLLENQLANVYESLDALLEQNKEWLSIRLTGDSGQQLYPLDISPPLNIYPKHVRVLHQPVGFLGSNLAKLEVMVNFWPILTEAEELEKELQFVLLVLLAVYMLMTAGAMEWLVRLRLQQLARAADQLASGNYDTSLPKKTRDEIGDLVASFTTMRDALQVYHLQLKGEIDNHQRTAASLKKEKERATYQATHDSLTGLINRREFERRLTDVQQQAKQNGSHHVLLYMDLDQFKIVNDTCGHVAGDLVLRQIAELLKPLVKEKEILARLGGDEFGALLESYNIEDAKLIAEEMRDVIRKYRFIWTKKVFEIGVSIGIVKIVPGMHTLSDVLSSADAACYLAKESGGNHVQVYQYDADDYKRRKDQISWIQRISQAFAENRFVLFAQKIQPLHSTHSDLEHYEILIRMIDDKGQMIVPQEYIAAAERYRTMRDIDRWVVRNAFIAIDEYIQRCSQDSSLPKREFSINLSGQSIGSESALGYIQDLLEEFATVTEFVVFEITETAAITNLESAQNFIRTLRNMGVRFSLDDFGTGVSSFNYLKNLQVDYLKIDGGFVREMDADPVDFAMVRSINHIGHVIGIKTIAEHAESSVICDRLREIGVDFAQGYWLHEPERLSNILLSKANA